MLTPFTHRKSGQIYRIVSSVDETVIMYKISGRDTITTIIPNAGGAVNIPTTSGSFAYLSSTEPIMVVQLATGNQGDDVGDPIMTLVSPTRKFVSSTLLLH